MVEVKELPFIESQKILNHFQLLENSYGIDWYDCEHEDAHYIWLLENIDEPLGFLSYKVLITPNKVDLIYIVKIYVLKSHRGENATLIDDERVSEILFRQIYRKGVNILTLESAHEKLDAYYKKLGFRYNKDMSDYLGLIIGTRGQIMARFIKQNELS